MFDPANLAPKTTASDKTCAFPSNYTPADDMDQYDMDEPDIVTPTIDPDQFFEPPSSRIKKFDSILRNPDICLTPPSIDKILGLHLAQEDPYTGESLLQFFPTPVKLHPDLKKPSRVKRRPSSTVSYPTSYEPPMTDDTVDITDVSPSTLVGRRVAKQFRTGVFIGTITETWIDDDNFDQYWRVLFDDTDVHDLTLTELTTALQLYKLYPTEYRFPSDDTNPTPSLVPVPTSATNNSISSDFRGAPSPQASQPVVSDFRGAQPLRASIPRAAKKNTSAATRALTRLGLAMFLSSAVLQPLPISSDLITPAYIASIFPPPIKTHPPDILPHDPTEELRAYHSYLDCLNDMFLPDPEKKLWTPQTILSHHVRTVPTTNVRHIYMKIQWSDHPANFFPLTPFALNNRGSVYSMLIPMVCLTNLVGSGYRIILNPIRH